MTLMNDTCLSGRITKDPELVPTEKSKAVSFTLAVNREFSKEKTADFIPCVCFGQPAEFLAQYVKKGDLIELQGRIQTRNYQNKNGGTVYVTEVVANRVGLLAKVQGQAEQSTITHTHTVEETVNISDDDLPF